MTESFIERVTTKYLTLSVTYKHEDSHCVRHCDSEIDSKFSDSYSNIEVTETVVGNGAVTVQ